MRWKCTLLLSIFCFAIQAQIIPIADEDENGNWTITMPDGTIIYDSADDSFDVVLSPGKGGKLKQTDCIQNPDDCKKLIGDAFIDWFNSIMNGGGVISTNPPDGEEPNPDEVKPDETNPGADNPDQTVPDADPIIFDEITVIVGGTQSYTPTEEQIKAYEQFTKKPFHKTKWRVLSAKEYRMIRKKYGF